MPIIIKKIAPAKLWIAKPAASRLRATVPWNYIRWPPCGRTVERFCNLEFGSAIFFLTCNHKKNYFHKSFD